MYQDTLKEHWKNLYSDFAQEYDRLKMKGKEPDCFDDWYHTRIHRFQSVAYPEGIILEQVGNAEFLQALTDTMKEFRFELVEPQEGKPLWQGILLGIAAGGASALLLLLLHWETVRLILSGIVVFVVVFLGFWRSEQAAKLAEQKRVKETYVGQLRDYWEKLSDVCGAFEEDEA